MKRLLELPPTADGRRLDVVLGEALGLSRARVKALFEARAVRVDGRRPSKGDRARAGARVEVELAEEAAALVAEPALPLRVLHEDAQLVAVDKPAGVASHPLRPGETGTVANALVARYPDCAAAGEDPREGGLVHRLDIETSGVLLAARDRATWEAVRALFGARRVDKRYWALAAGPIAEQGVVDVPLRHRGETRVEPALDGGEPGREAVTEFRVLGRSGELALLDVRLITGVLHQIRAHLAAIGAPVVGDALYGGRALPGLDRFFLHAHALELVHPSTGRSLRIESPLPGELLRVLEAVGLPAPVA
ncbi:MAG TPA: RluA family pseudouridine synthase [Myxococcaceae bacterium]|nr:RluA family pseudouridine synthase [Myxococcaceae bacterium]